MKQIIDGKKITPEMDEPANRVIFAVNHYISTGDHIGEGVSFDQGPSRIFVIPVKALPEDQENLARLHARLDEIIWMMPLFLMDRIGDTDMWGLAVPYIAMEELAKELMAKPGPLGWGTCKAAIDSRTDWEI